MLYKKPQHPQRPMSWFWCVQNKHTRGRERRKERGGTKVKRVDRGREKKRIGKEKEDCGRKRARWRKRVKNKRSRQRERIK